MATGKALNGKLYAGNPHIQFDDGENTFAFRRKCAMTYRAVLSAVAGLSIFSAAFAESFVWTGSADSCWTNPANWTVGGVVAARSPGVLETELDTSSGTLQPAAKFNDAAAFGTLSGVSAVTIDMKGLYSISNVVVSGDTAYTFGADSTQVFPLGPGGRFEVLSDTAVMPVFAGAFATPAGGWNSNPSVYIYNRTNKILHFNEFGKVIRPTGSSSWQRVYVYLYGNGNRTQSGFQFDGRVTGKSGWSVDLYVYTTGKLVFNSDMRDSFYRFCNYSVDLEVEVKKDAVFGLGGDNGAGITMFQSFSISGDGKVAFPYKSGVSTYDARGHFINNTVNAVCDIRVPVEISRIGNGTDPNEFIIKANSVAGTIAFSGENNMDCGIADNGKMMLRVSDAGWFKQKGLVFAGEGGVEYTGREATFSENISITNGNTVTIRNSGTGTLTFASAVNVTKANGTVRLEGDTAPLVYGCSFAGNIPSVVTISGDKGVELPGTLDLSSIPVLNLESGTLTVCGSGSKTIESLDISSGANTIVVEDGISLSIDSSVLASGASLDIQPVGTSSVAIPSLAGTAPAAVTYCGMPVVFDGNGIAGASVPGAVMIAATGDTVPSANLVVIGSAGAGGNNSLDGDAVTVGDFRHLVPMPSTIAMGEGQTLTASTITLGPSAASLSVGDVAGRGVLAGVNGGIAFTNSSTEASLTVKSRLADGMVVPGALSTGVITLAGGASAENPLIVSNFGNSATLKLAGDEMFYIGAGSRVGTVNSPIAENSFVLDGARDVRIGASGLMVAKSITHSASRYVRPVSMKITNSLFRVNAFKDSNYDSSGATANEYNLVIGGDSWGSFGKLEICAGSILTNRITLGQALDSGNNKQSSGYVRQTGGEVTALANTDDGRGSAVGGGPNGLGVYELECGKFVSLGSFGVGGNAKGGLFLQTGGESVFTNSLHGAAGKGGLIVGFQNGAYGHMAFMGGNAHISGTLRLSYGSGASSSMAFLTIAGDAFVDMGDLPVSGTPAGINSYGPGTKWCKQGYMNLNGGTFRTAGIGKTVQDVDRFVAVSFNGGVLKTGASGKEVFSPHDSTCVKACDVVAVFGGGAIVDTDGKTGNKTSVPLSAPTGGCVSAVPLAATYYCSLRPMVTITGDGMGASAMAEYDHATGRITGIKVISPGWGYTWANCKVSVAEQDVVSSVACTIDANPASGSFTKRGEGDFTLNAANTYGGDTVLEGGVLKLGVTGALPDGSALVFKGGTLEVAPEVELPSVVDVNIGFAPKPKTRHTLIAFPAGKPANVPLFNLSGVDSKWVLRVTDSSVRLLQPAGVIMSFR